MYKYTNLLSDSYRQKQGYCLPHSEQQAAYPGKKPQRIDASFKPYQRSPVKPIRPQLTENTRTYQSFYQPHAVQNQTGYRAQYLEDKIDKGYHTIQKLNSSLQHIPRHQYQQDLKGPTIYQKKERWNNEELRGDRFSKMTELSGRNQAALRQVDLQNKIKNISDKYSMRNGEDSGSTFQKYKRQFNQKWTKNDSNPKLYERQDNYNDYAKERQSNKHSYTDYSFTKTSQLSGKDKYVPYKQKYSDLHTMQKPVISRPVYSRSKQPENNIPNFKHSTNPSHYLKQTKDISRPIDQAKWTPNSYDGDRSANLRSLYSNAGADVQKGVKAVQKLNSLQDRIKSSIKSYHNL